MYPANNAGSQNQKEVRQAFVMSSVSSKDSLSVCFSVKVSPIQLNFSIEYLSFGA